MGLSTEVVVGILAAGMFVVPLYSYAKFDGRICHVSQRGPANSLSASSRGGEGATGRGAGSKAPMSRYQAGSLSACIVILIQGWQ